MNHLYLYYVQKLKSDLFPKTVPYKRFVELMQAAALPMAIFMKTCCLSEETGISFIDSTPIRACEIKRIKRNKVFEGLAQVSKLTMAYFFGFKVYIVINDKGGCWTLPSRRQYRRLGAHKNKSFIKPLRENYTRIKATFQANWHRCCSWTDYIWFHASGTIWRNVFF